ncbi:MAG TPA: class I SAM-dependent methyltransferase [Pyrinomonadaceae bacterium]|jgi:SAM-dependent methyltransferase
MATLRQQIRRLVPASLRPHLGSLRRRVRAHPLLVESHRQRLLEDPALGARRAALLAGVSTRVHPDDGMYAGEGAHYFAAGLSAVDCVDEVLRRAAPTGVRAALDLPSGYGRELRFFVRRFPAAAFTACDIQPGAVRFCAAAFGATPVVSQPDLEQIAFARRFDLVWCGSLVTHLDAAATRSLLRLFARSLGPRGVMIFTTHGDSVAERIVGDGAFYDMPRDYAEAIADSYAATGHGYHDYPRGLGYFDFHPEGSGYGISLTSPAWVRAAVAEIGGLREVYFAPRGWANHQDVYGFQKPG